MKSPFSILFLWLLPLLALISFSPVAHAQDNPSAPGLPAVAAVVSVAPAPAPAPVAGDAPKVTARKPEDEEQEVKPAASAEDKPVVPGAEQHAKTMNMLQSAAASLFGIPTETSNAAEVARLTTSNADFAAQVATLQGTVSAHEATIARLQGELAQGSAELSRVSGQYAELNTSFETLIAAPAALLKKDPASLTPPQAALQTAIVAGVEGEIRSVGQPAAHLPGPGADEPKQATQQPLDPVAKEEQRRQFFLEDTRRRMKGADSN